MRVLHREFNAKLSISPLEIGERHVHCIPGSLDRTYAHAYVCHMYVTFISKSNRSLIAGSSA